MLLVFIDAIDMIFLIPTPFSGKGCENSSELTNF